MTRSKENESTHTNPLNIPMRKFAKSRGKIPVFVYLRLSPTNIKGIDEKGTRDFSRQEQTLKKYIEEELGDGYFIAGQFRDVLTGQDANRTEYRKLMAGLKARKAKVVLASSMSRWGRNVPEFLKSVEEVRGLDCELRLIRNNLIINNEINPIQELMMTIFAAVGEFEATIASERVREKLTILRENPFWWTGQKPKIFGENWKRFVELYYAKKYRTGGHGTILLDEDGEKIVSFRNSLEVIGDEMGLSKGSVSNIIARYVDAGIMVARYPKIVEATGRKDIDFLGLPAHSKDDGRTKGTHSILHPYYWTEEVRRKVAKKFGNYKKLEKFSNREKSLEAWDFGKLVYLGWMKAFVRSAIENSEIELHHGRMMKSMGGLSGIVENMSDGEISQMSVDELASIEKDSEE